MPTDVTPKPKWPEPEYLGDGLYACYNGYQVELYASNGVMKTNKVFLDPGVLGAFLNYIDRLKTLGGK
jgi:hypothetical protein